MRSSEGGSWKSTNIGNSLAAYPTCTHGSEEGKTRKGLPIPFALIAPQLKHSRTVIAKIDSATSVSNAVVSFSNFTDFGATQMMSSNCASKCTSMVWDYAGSNESRKSITPRSCVGLEPQAMRYPMLQKLMKFQK